MQYNTTLYYIIPYKTEQYNTTLYHMIQYNTVQNNTIEYNIVIFKRPHDIIRSAGTRRKKTRPCSARQHFCHDVKSYFLALYCVSYIILLVSLCLFIKILCYLYHYFFMLHHSSTDPFDACRDI